MPYYVEFSFIYSELHILFFVNNYKNQESSINKTNPQPLSSKETENSSTPTDSLIDINNDKSNENISYSELLSLASSININDLKSNYNEFIKIQKNNS
ncbi:MAG: hypothetical protein SOR73_11940 [Romboutsia timonensis]|uniref:hypothetical protein n=1 Tax=Romboutsia timonensis TaxID=1776391 RepID=UPI002A75B8CA|nr:hypothetical protein [Romboutsia timonensis]MCI6668951.1 hypothetical protein [Romboutsia timonensis]MDY3002361.1 hypothetical protein [Romboutsia timonensis]